MTPFEASSSSEYAPTAERDNKLRQLPSSTAFMQEGSKFIRQPDRINDSQLASKFNLPAECRSVLTEMQSQVPSPDVISNLAKWRLAKGAVLNYLLSTKNPQLTLDAAKYVVADPTIQEETRAKINFLKETSSPDLAKEKDLNYLRARGSEWLVMRVESGKLSRPQAIALASTFDSIGTGLSQLDRAKIVSRIISGEDATTGLDTNQQQVAGQIRLQVLIFNKLLEVGFTKFDSLEHVPYSDFVGLLSKVRAEMELCADKNSLLLYAKETVRKDGIPEQVSNLSSIAEIVKNHPEIKAVSFDMYDTMVQWSSNQGERRDQMDKLAAALLKQKYGMNISPDQMRLVSESAWTKRWTDFQERGNEVLIEETMGWMVDGILNDRQTTGGRDMTGSRGKMVKDLVKEWYRVELDTAVAMPEAAETLRRLKSMGIKIGLTSNASWSEAHVRRVLDRFDLLQYFDAITRSAENLEPDPNKPAVRRMKKDNVKEFFHHSWRKLGVNPDQVLHVGDNPSDDVNGARFAGARSVEFNNPNSYRDIEIDRNIWSNAEKYRQVAFDHHLEAQDLAAREEIEQLLERRKIPHAEREMVRRMALEIYSKSRGIFGQAYVAVADRALQRLSNGESELNICMGRDSIPIAIAQKLLLHLEPDRYPGAKSKKIKYAYINRKLLAKAGADSAIRTLGMNRSEIYDPMTEAAFQQYFDQLGASRSNKITVIDFNSLSGSTQNAMRELLPGKSVTGLFLDSQIPGSIGVMNELLTGASFRDESGEKIRDKTLFFESLYPARKSSPEGIKKQQGDLHPEISDAMIPPESLVRGLSEQSLRLLNHMAIVGLQDCVKTVHRRRQLGLSDYMLRTPDQIISLTPKGAIEAMYRFVSVDPSELPLVWQHIKKSLLWDGVLPSKNAWDVEEFDGVS